MDLRLILGILVACLISLLIISYAFNTKIKAEIKRRCTLKTVGTVVDIKERMVTETDNENRVKNRYMTYCLVFEIERNNKKYIVFDDSYQSSYYFMEYYGALPEIGDCYELYIDPEDPTNVVFEPNNYLSTGIFGPMLVGVGIFGAFFVIFSYLSAIHVFD